MSIAKFLRTDILKYVHEGLLLYLTYFSEQLFRKVYLCSGNWPQEKLPPVRVRVKVRARVKVGDNCPRRLSYISISNYYVCFT